jgi:6-phosphogluconolactonase (cycloisomerase 2 family)
MSRPSWTGLWALVLTGLSLCIGAATASAGAFVTLVPGSPFSTGAGASPSAVAFSPSGSLLALVNDDGTGSVYLFAVSASGVAPAASATASTGANSYPAAVAFSPDGRLLATADGGTDKISLFAVSGSALTPVQGSPFSTGAAGGSPVSVAFSPDGGLLATANGGQGGTDNLSLFKISASGLTAVSGSPYPTGANTGPDAVAFSPSGGLLASVNNAADEVALFKVSGSGLTPSGSPTSTGVNSRPVALAFSPSGGLLVTADINSQALSLFSVGSSGLTPVGSPVSDSPAAGPQAVAFAGAVLAVANSGSHNISMYSATATGLVALTGSPFSAGGGNTNQLAFGPSGRLLATVGSAANDVSLLALSGPAATISAPADGATYTQNQAVAAGYACSDAGGGPGITACAGPAANGSAVDTTTPGAHTFTVTATSASGQSATATSTYSVVVAPVVTSPPPVVGAHQPRPVVSGARQSHPVWRRGSRIATVSATRRRPVGTRFDFALNENATVALAFTQRVAGRRVKGRCGARTGRRRAPACRIVLTRGVLSVRGRSGANRVSFQGPISRSTQLRPGAYTVTIIATNAGGQRSQPRSLRFTIVG